MPTSPRRVCAALAVLALGTGPLVAPPAAQALPVFTKAEIDAEGLFVNRSTVTCTRAATTSAPAFGVPVADNGPATTASASASGTMTRDADPSDVLSVAARFDASTTVASQAGSPRSFGISGAGSVAATTTQSGSLCGAEAVAHVALVHAFTVSQDGFLTITTTAGPHTLVLVDLEDSATGDRLVHLVGEGSKLSGPLTVRLAPGSYLGDVEVGARVRTSVAVPSTAVNASVRGEFTVAGSRLTASGGKGGTYVALPDARSCGGHVLLPAVTDRKRQVRRIKRLAFFVNGAPASKVRTPHRGLQVALSLADESRADVRAEVTLVPSRKRRAGTVLVTTATYEACS